MLTRDVGFCSLWVAGASVRQHRDLHRLRPCSAGTSLTPHRLRPSAADTPKLPPVPALRGKSRQWQIRLLFPKSQLPTWKGTDACFSRAGVAAEHLSPSGSPSEQKPPPLRRRRGSCRLPRCHRCVFTLRSSNSRVSLQFRVRLRSRRLPASIFGLQKRELTMSR